MERIPEKVRGTPIHECTNESYWKLSLKTPFSPAILKPPGRQVWTAFLKSSRVRQDIINIEHKQTTLS